VINPKKEKVVLFHFTSYKCRLRPALNFNQIALVPTHLFMKIKVNVKAASGTGESLTHMSVIGFHWKTSHLVSF